MEGVKSGMYQFGSKGNDMVGFVFGAFGAFIRWIFIYDFNSKKMGEAFNTNPQLEGSKNRYAGLFLIPLGIIVGFLIKY